MVTKVYSLMIYLTILRKSTKKDLDPDLDPDPDPDGHQNMFPNDISVNFEKK